MYTKPAKKMIMLNILDILKKYTDENHRLSQKEIGDILKNEYCMEVERKAIKRNLMNLIEFGYEIEYSEAIRMMPVKDTKTGEITLEESYILSDFYLVREFSDSELRLTIDSLLFSNHIPSAQRKKLIDKLARLSNTYFRSKNKHIHAAPQIKNDNKQMFYTIDILDEAISKKRQVSFTYCEYGTDKQLHRRCRPDGTVREYIINPYQMAAKEGKYYLICNHDKYDDISNYRIDRIADIKILDSPAKPFENLHGADKNGLNLQKYMAEHIYMFSSDNVRTDFRIPRAMISDVIDVFGDSVSFYNETDTHVTVSAYVNKLAMFHYAKSFAPDVVVLTPKSLVDKIREDIKRSAEVYNNEED